MHLSVTEVKKQYATVLAVDHLSFEVKSGEIFALLGPNGAGKSSTIRMLIGLTRADTGNISFANQQGEKYERLDSADFGYLPEERGLYQENSILKSLEYMGQLKGMSRADAQSEAQKWLEKFDLHERQKDPLKTLSKGNQQKVQLISAIIHQPAIVFLDEPFSGLDPVNQEKVIEFLVMLKQQGTTIILSAHQMSLVEKLADRFLLMDQGRAALYGSMQEIRQKSQLGSTLNVHFSEPVNASDFDLKEGINDILQIDERELKFSLNPTCHVPTLLQSLLSEQSIESLQTQQPSLHDIYLNSVKGTA